MAKYFCFALFLASIAVFMVAGLGLKRFDFAWSQYFQLLGISAACLIGSVVFAGLSVKATDKTRAKPVRAAQKNEQFSATEAKPTGKIDELAETRDRTAARPAWFLSLRSPFAEDQIAGSWFGGLPTLPKHIEWPRDSQGRAMHFVTQIDLADLGDTKPVGLAKQGQMLIFVSFQHRDQDEYRILNLSEEDMRFAYQRDTPKDLSDLSDAGFWNVTKTFHHWPLDFTYRMDAGDNREYDEPNPEDWITTWGIAAAEAKQLLSARAIHEPSWAQYTEGRTRRDETSEPLTPREARAAAHFAAMKEHGPAFFQLFDAFVAKANAMPPDAAIDRVLLAETLKQRRAFAERLGGFQFTNALTPSRQAMEDRLVSTYFDQKTGQFRDDVDAQIPRALKGMLSEAISGYRFHRLWGKADPPSTQSHDLHGLECLFMLSGDPLLGLQTEHEDGFSIWCPRKDLAAGEFETGKIVWHTAV